VIVTKSTETQTRRRFRVCVSADFVTITARKRAGRTLAVRGPLFFSVVRGDVL
jgi:hypothetical protein